MRLLVFAGKGGAGTTTVAAATAVAAARAGRTTLLASLEPTPELGPLLGATVPGAEPVEAAENLTVCHLDPREPFERLWDTGAYRFAAVVESFGVTVPDADSLTVPPGLDALLALQRLRLLAADGRWDVVVLDSAVGRRAAALLAWPQQAARHLGAVLPAERQVVRALRPVLATLAGVPAPPAEAFEAAESAQTELTAITALLTAPSTTVRLVSTATAASLAVTRRLASAVALFDMAVDGLVLTGPPSAMDADKALPGLGAVAVHRFPWRSTPPAGVEELASAAVEAFGADADVTATAGGVVPETGPVVERAADGYTYRIPLPFAERGTTGLVRHGDELVVTVGTDRRVLALPPVLRRCTVRRARLVGGTLAVSFVPDESAWMRRPAAGPAGPEAEAES